MTMSKGLVTFLSLITLGLAVGGGYYAGDRNVRHNAVDSGAAQYSMADQYGNVEFHWTTAKTDTNGKAVAFLR